MAEEPPANHNNEGFCEDMYNSTLAGVNVFVALILVQATILFSYIHTEEYADTKRKFRMIVVTPSKWLAAILLAGGMLFMAKPAAANVTFLVISVFVNIILTLFFIGRSINIYRRRAKRKG